MPSPPNPLDDRQRELLIEQQKLTQLRRIIDVTCAILSQSHISFLEACGLMREAKALALQLFPDKEDTFELLYRRRFTRIIAERMQRTPGLLN